MAVEGKQVQEVINLAKKSITILHPVGQRRSSPEIGPIRMDLDGSTLTGVEFETGKFGMTLRWRSNFRGGSILRYMKPNASSTGLYVVERKISAGQEQADCEVYTLGNAEITADSWNIAPFFDFRDRARVVIPSQKDEDRVMLELRTIATVLNA